MYRSESTLQIGEERGIRLQIRSYCDDGTTIVRSLEEGHQSGLQGGRGISGARPVNGPQSPAAPKCRRYVGGNRGSSIPKRQWHSTRGLCHFASHKWTLVRILHRVQLPPYIRHWEDTAIYIHRLLRNKGITIVRGIAVCEVTIYDQIYATPPPRLRESDMMNKANPAIRHNKQAYQP